jgi:hypothetical protein
MGNFTFVGFLFPIIPFFVTPFVDVGQKENVTKEDVFVSI